jgi:hypothetical protein
MIMRYFGGGIGHLGNSPRQVNSEQPDTEGVEEEMEINDDGIDNLNASGPGEDIIMNFEVENSDDEPGLGPESESDSDEESDEGSDDDSEGSEEDGASVDPEDSDDDGYGSF